MLYLRRGISERKGYTTGGPNPARSYGFRPGENIFSTSPEALRALAAFSEKRENLRLIIETGDIVYVNQRPEETNRQSLTARRRESLLEHCRRAPVNAPEQDLMRAFDCQQNIAAILGRPQNNIVVAQSPVGLDEVIAGKRRTIAADQIDSLAAVIEFPAHCGC